MILAGNLLGDGGGEWVVLYCTVYLDGQVVLGLGLSICGAQGRREMCDSDVGDGYRLEENVR